MKEIIEKLDAIEASNVAAVEAVKSEAISAVEAAKAEMAEKVAALEAKVASVQAPEIIQAIPKTVTYQAALMRTPANGSRTVDTTRFSAYMVTKPGAVCSYI